MNRLVRDSRVHGFLFFKKKRRGGKSDLAINVVIYISLTFYWSRWRDDDRPLTNGSQYLGSHNADAWPDDIIRAVSNGNFNNQRQGAEIGNQRGRA